MDSIFALVDCNNFFVSCERVANPKLNNLPVIVLSNADGCVVSRSNEAKRLDIAMGVPFFQIRDLVKQHGVVALPANFALYGDLSAQVMDIITHEFPDVAIYSVDEAFIDLTCFQANFDLYNLCVKLNQKIAKNTGIPVSIGIASTKTLSKIANHVVKTNNIPNRVLYLQTQQQISSILEELKIRDIWGIGRKLDKRLRAMGVYTAQDLINLSPRVIARAFNVYVQRTVLELQGISCIKLNDSAIKKQIMVSRSFKYRLTELAEIQEALATYASMACEKLRAQHSAARGVYVFLHTSLHAEFADRYKNSIYINLPTPSFDTSVIIHAAKDGLEQIFKPNYLYKKVGIILCDLIDAQAMQMDLFVDDLQHSEELMHLLDKINQKFGRDTIQFAASGLIKPWKIRNTDGPDAHPITWHSMFSAPKK